jgi:MoxR-like ATPase
MNWYIDRSRNLSSLFTSTWYSKLVDIALDDTQIDKFDNKSSELISELGISGKNPFAILTYLRDIGIIDDNNNATDFFKCCLRAKLSNEQIILLILLKRNDNKNEASDIKPFVVISKALALMNELSLPLSINWHQCINYLMPVKKYDEIDELLVNSMSADTSDNPSSGPDIWFNALLSTGLFTGTNTKVELKPDYIDFFRFIAKYGDELTPNKSREDYISQSKDALYGIYNMFKKHAFDGIVLLGNIIGIYDYISEANKLDEKTSVLIDYDTCTREKGAQNIILYGVPGAGKSWAIKNEYCDDNTRMERLVFHPDYTYSDFVGQILPRVSDDGTVSYEFAPGPFTKLLRKAYTNPDKIFFLVIEEVNRGNAPAIFGDIFQLLDRDSEGNSEYEITNGDIARVVYCDENHKVFIPSNMSILCTMNTSDQNVFTLDTAFQRRWNMRLIKNKFSDEPEEKAFAETKILDTSVTWNHFFTEINKIILSKNIRMTSSEDKRLGTHFINDEDLKYISGNDKQNSKFSEKVLKYLWDDAFKFTKEDIFDLTKVNSLEDVIEIFAGSVQNERFKVFKENIYTTLVTSKTSSTESA